MAAKKSKSKKKGNSKRPGRRENPQATKQPHGAEKVAQASKELVAWRIRLLDDDGPWGWHRVDRETVVHNVLAKLRDFETMTFDEIMSSGGGSHPIPVKNLCSDAQVRLEEIGQDDVDELFSLRLKGEERVYGIRDRNVYKILWWDPNHEVCPSALKHT